MSFVYILITVALGSAQSLFLKLFTTNYAGKEELASSVFCVYESVFIVLFTWLLKGFCFSADAITWVLGLAGGIILWSFNDSFVRASKTGSFAFLNIISLFGDISLTLLFNVIFLHVPLTPWQSMAIGGVLLACVLMNWRSIRLKETPICYYLFCAVNFLTNGISSVLSKVQSVCRYDQRNERILLMFAVMGIVALIQLCQKESKNTAVAFKVGRKSVLPLLICVFSAGLRMVFVAKILPLVNQVVFAAAVNCGVVLVSAACSVWIFKEKLSREAWLGLGIEAISIAVLSI